MKIEGAILLITGGANGIGKMISIRMLEKGAQFVAILDFDTKNGTDTERELGEKFGTQRVKFFQCDVSDDKQLSASFQKAYDQHKRLDVVINNAGVGKEEANTIAINLLAVIKGSYLAKDIMSKANGGKGGVLINVASIAGMAPTAFPLYSASKFGVLGFTLSLPLSDTTFSADDIRTNAVCPFFVRTQLALDLLDVAPDETKKVFTDSAINYLSNTLITDAFEQIIEDDSIHAQAVRITPRKGIDFPKFPTTGEMAEEFGYMKE